MFAVKRLVGNPVGMNTVESQSCVGIVATRQFNVCLGWVRPELWSIFHLVHCLFFSLVVAAISSSFASSLSALKFL